MTIEEENLNILKDNINYNKWIYNLMENYLRDNILEIGCGIGNITEFLLQNNRKVLLTYINKKNQLKN